MKDRLCANVALLLGSVCTDFTHGALVTMMQLADSPKFLMHWDHQCNQRLLRDVVCTTHRLAELPLFSDHGLASIIDRYPASAMFVTTTGDDAAHPSELQYGTFGDHDGRTWIDMIRRGRLCLRLANVCRHDDDLGEIVRRLCGEMMECQPGFHSDSHEGDLWITSPYVIHYFGIDRDPRVFWQIRGHRKISHYPLGEPFVLNQTLQQIVAGSDARPIYFEPAFDKQVQFVEQVPGDVLGLPLHTPYRVATSGTLSLTLTTKYQTRQTHRQIEVMRANHRLNRWLSNQNRSQAVTGPLSLAKRILLRCTNRLIAGEVSSIHEPTFRVDPNAAKCIGPVDSNPIDAMESSTKSTFPIFPRLTVESVSFAPTGTEN